VLDKTFLDEDLKNMANRCRMETQLLTQLNSSHLMVVVGKCHKDR